MRLLIVDNYDSFTYNLFHLFKEAGCRHIDVIKNDKVILEDIACYDKIVFSPGPGIPSDAPVMHDILTQFQSTKSILGVCLGFQAIGCFYGAKLLNLSQPQHGIASILKITDRNEKLFQGLDNTIKVGRYHSWVIDNNSVPDCLTVTSVSEDGYIMSFAHKQFDIKGMQFHPESYITAEGIKIAGNWLL